jgi:outer membrane immunogenic protein
MKRIYLIIIMIVFSIFTIKAQQNVSRNGKQFNAGVGLSGTGFPIYAGIDFYLRNDISLGVEGSLRAYNENWSGNNYRHTIIGLSLNGNYHFSDKLEIPKEWDVYGGLNIGFYSWFSPSDYNGSGGSGIGIGGQIGSRYFFTRTFALNFELHGGTTLVGCKIGVTQKF